MADYKLTGISAKRRGRIEHLIDAMEGEKKLKERSKKTKVSPEELKMKDLMMAKAAQFVSDGIPFDMAPDELKESHFFKIGYDVAMRRQRALEFEKNKKARGR